MATKITWLGHSGVQIQLESGEVILIDPWTSGPTFPAEHEFDRVDLLLITHGHFDHIANAVEIAEKHKPQVVAIFETAAWLGSKGVENITGMNKGGSCELLGCRVTLTHAQHSNSIQDGDQTVYGGEAAGFVVKLPDGRSLYHAGDTNVFSDMQLIRRLYSPELAMLPIGDLYTMDPREAAIAAEFIQAAKVLPLHYGTFPPLVGTPSALRDLLGEAGVSAEVLEPQPGETISW